MTFLHWISGIPPHAIVFSIRNLADTVAGVPRLVSALSTRWPPGTEGASATREVAASSSRRAAGPGGSQPPHPPGDPEKSAAPVPAAATVDDAPLSRQQIDAYLRRQFPYPSIRNWKRRKAAAKLVAGIPELGDQPILLALVPDLVREGRSIDQLFGLYGYLVEQWLQRERKWIQPDALRDIAIELAVVAFLQRSSGRGDRVTSPHVDSIASAHQSPLASWKLDSRSLLNRDAHGQFGFAHHSAMEYLFVLAAVDGDRRCLSVGWTDFMKDLFVSWGSSAGGARAEAFLEQDLTRAKLYPLANPLGPPGRRSPAECLEAFHSDRISLRHGRRIPAQWRNLQLVAKELAPRGSVPAYEIFDPVHGIRWLLTDVSNTDERDLYRDPYAPAPATAESGDEALRATAKRHPSIEEMMTLWESEPHLVGCGSIAGLLTIDELYWLGDSTDVGPLCCSFGDDALSRPCLKLMTSRQDASGRRAHLYEFQSRYGMHQRVAYRAMCAHVVEEIVETEC